MGEATGKIEYFPTHEGEYPSDWIREQLANGYIVVQVYGANGLGPMWRQQFSITNGVIDAAENPHLHAFIGREIVRIVKSLREDVDDQD